MDGQTLQAAAAIGVPSLGAVIWLLRLEGRLRTQESLHHELKEDMQETRRDVQYIRERIDRALDQR